jgi:hypothetical protein
VPTSALANHPHKHVFQLAPALSLSDPIALSDALPQDLQARAIRIHSLQDRGQLGCRIDLSAWPEGSRLFARPTKLTEGEQQSFADHDGHRLAVFLTDQDSSVPDLDLTHRGHAHVEDHIREGKDCGLRNLPFRSFAHNQVWLWLVMLAQDLIAWTKQPTLADQERCWELKRIRYRLLHQSGRIARHARRKILRLACDWPWSGQLATAFQRLQALPALSG